MKLCKDCKHYKHIKASEFDADSPRDECRENTTKKINYVTGKETTNYGYCFLINTDGNCEKYEEKK